MTRRTRVILVAATLASAVALAACKKQEAPAPEPTAAPAPATAIPSPAVTVTDLSVGKSVGADKKIQNPTDTFSSKDTIFAAVSTEGSAPSTVIAVKWTFGDGQTVKEDSRTIAPTGPSVTEFSIQNPKGWPKGSYKVETTVDGKPGPSKTFTVK